PGQGQPMYDCARGGAGGFHREGAQSRLPGFFFSSRRRHTRSVSAFLLNRSSDLTSAVSDKLLDLVGLGGKSAADKGKDTRDYLAAAFPELNAWERAGADASSAGMVDAGFENQKELTKMQLDNQKEIAEMQNE